MNDIIIFSEKKFCFSGEISGLSRIDAQKEVCYRGGIVVNSVTNDLDYLIVGGIRNKDWKYVTHGLKTEKALEIYLHTGKDIIVNEGHFLDSLALTIPLENGNKADHIKIKKCSNKNNNSSKRKKDDVCLSSSDKYEPLNLGNFPDKFLITIPTYLDNYTNLDRYVLLKRKEIQLLQELTLSNEVVKSVILATSEDNNTGILAISNLRIFFAFQVGTYIRIRSHILSDIVEFAATFGVFLNGLSISQLRKGRQIKYKFIRKKYLRYFVKVADQILYNNK